MLFTDLIKGFILIIFKVLQYIHNCSFEAFILCFSCILFLRVLLLLLLGTGGDLLSSPLMIVSLFWCLDIWVWHVRDFSGYHLILTLLGSFPIHRFLLPFLDLRALCMCIFWEGVLLQVGVSEEQNWTRGKDWVRLQEKGKELLFNTKGAVQRELEVSWEEGILQVSCSQVTNHLERQGWSG